ncbi:hypothetical protein SNE26_20420 [Mucilaginibacter sp. cycad4]|uniref:hypothetical protein n=1 Tax=Mucilaginibacter sp. cycad4 TaxID=3342096 RepID=UPI002AAAD0B1|nr:hypothetical protein [Mucilaginibacter gossypii]WPU98394.1 hypothetical protein SNE26_20420 [Mucilaginibacter gossypii]
MTLKLTIRQAEALYNVFRDIVNQDPAPDVTESLLKDLLKQVFRKLESKLEARLKGGGYSISLTDMEAKAYYLYFNQRYLGEGWRYEQTFINDQVRLLNKLYA